MQCNWYHTHKKNILRGRIEGLRRCPAHPLQHSRTAHRPAPLGALDSSMAWLQETLRLVALVAVVVGPSAAFIVAPVSFWEMGVLLTACRVLVFCACSLHGAVSVESASTETKLRLHRS